MAALQKTYEPAFSWPFFFDKMANTMCPEWVICMFCSMFNSADQSMFFTLLSASLSRIFYGANALLRQQWRPITQSLRWSPSVTVWEVWLNVDRQLVWKCWWLWHSGQKHEADGGERWQTGSVGWWCYEWRQIKVQVRGPVCSVGSKVWRLPEGC